MGVSDSGVSMCKTSKAGRRWGGAAAESERESRQMTKDLKGGRGERDCMKRIPERGHNPSKCPVRSAPGVYVRQ